MERLVFQSLALLDGQENWEQPLTNLYNMCDRSTTNGAIDSSDGRTDIDLPPRLSNVLRSVFTSHPRNPRLDRMTLQLARRRITHAEQRRRATFSIRRQRPRMSFHRMFSFSLSSGSSGASPAQTYTRTNSSGSDFHARLKLAYQDSLKSIELVSPCFYIQWSKFKISIFQLNGCSTLVLINTIQNQRRC